MDVKSCSSKTNIIYRSKYTINDKKKNRTKDYYPTRDDASDQCAPFVYLYRSNSKIFCPACASRNNANLSSSITSDSTSRCSSRYCRRRRSSNLQQRKCSTHEDLKFAYKHRNYYQRCMNRDLLRKHFYNQEDHNLKHINTILNKQKAFISKRRSRIKERIMKGTNYLKKEIGRCPRRSRYYQISSLALSKSIDKGTQTEMCIPVVTKSEQKYIPAKPQVTEAPKPKPTPKVKEIPDHPPLQRTSLKFRTLLLVALQLVIIASAYHVEDPNWVLNKGAVMSTNSPVYRAKRYLRDPTPVLMSTTAIARERYDITAICSMLCLYGIWPGSGKTVLPTILLSLITSCWDFIDTLVIAYYLNVSSNVTDIYPFTILSLAVIILQLYFCAGAIGYFKERLKIVVNITEGQQAEKVK